MFHLKCILKFGTGKIFHLCHTPASSARAFVPELVCVCGQLYLKEEISIIPLPAQLRLPQNARSRLTVVEVPLFLCMCVDARARESKSDQADLCVCVRARARAGVLAYLRTRAREQMCSHTCVCTCVCAYTTCARVCVYTPGRPSRYATRSVLARAQPCCPATMIKCVRPSVSLSLFLSIYSPLPPSPP